ncbi:alpha/beta-hydrolase [Pholiota conissans]|uniref:Alpha/beta-hydrolase n=1 Tax=Pholiota conissans TaxID=109636 RepID=A0A9P6CWN2_9AGAR|nr:alpha/beta-hydrolase [Pholiota conissans]
MIHHEQLEIDLSTNITIQADLWRPLANTSEEEGIKFAVFLHPWSWLGGRKGDPVLTSLVEPFVIRKYNVLSYNSRGVGGSSGWSSFTGFSEGEDLKAVCKWVLERFTDVRSLAIMGYSHGSLIASLHPVLPSVKTSHILLSYPLGPRSWLTLFKSSSYSTALHELVRHRNSNVLVIYGDQDEFTSVEKYRTWASDLAGENVEIVEVQNASHFWHGGSGRELETVISKWLP